MRQGLDGNLLVTSRMTPESFAPQFAIPFFVLLGYVGRVLPISLPLLYLLSRILGGIALMLGIYALIARFFHDGIRRGWAFFITLSGSFLPIIQDGRLEAPPHVLTWSELDPLIRLTYIPHHLWSKVLFVAIIFLLLRAETNKGLGKTLGALFCLSIVMGFTSPVIVVTFVMTIGVWLLAEWAVSVKKHGMFPWNVGMYGASVLLGCVLVLWYHWHLAHSVFPWTTYGPPWENNWLFLFSPWEYLTMLGPLFIVSITGLALGWWKERSVRLLGAWILSGWVLSFLMRRFLPFSGSRYLEGYQWIPIGILSVYGLSELIRRFVRTRQTFVFELAAGFLLLLSLPSLGISIYNAITRIDSARSDPRYYMNRDVEGALLYIETVRPPCTVASTDWFSTMVSSYSSCRSVSGHRLMTYENDQKIGELNAFLYWNEPMVDKERLIRKYGITHVVTMDGITGEDVKSVLHPVPEFRSGSVSVYRVR